MTDKTFEYSDNLIYNKSVEIRRAFSVQSKSIAENIDLLKNKSNRLAAVSQQMKHNIIQQTSTIGGNSTANTVSVPPYDKDNPISPTAGAQYIENAESGFVSQCLEYLFFIRHKLLYHIDIYLYYICNILFYQLLFCFFILI